MGNTEGSCLVWSSARRKEKEYGKHFDFTITTNGMLLNDDNIDSIVCIGKFKYDVATRLSYAGIKNEKLILVDDLNNLIKIIKEKTVGPIYTMVCFDMTAMIHKLIEGENHGNN